jgi:hypothetical protein
LTRSLLESVWFQPLNLKCDFMVSEFAVKFELYRYSEEILVPETWAQKMINLLDERDLGGALQVDSS